ncbi:MAG: hypothetical protein ACP5UO_05800 [Thermoplasmata archaeon]
MIGAYWIGNITLGAVEVIIFMIILETTLRSHRRTGAYYVKILSLFSGIMLLYSLAVVAVSILFSYRYGADVALPLLAVNAISLAGFATLFFFLNE